MKLYKVVEMMTGGNLNRLVVNGKPLNTYSVNEIKNLLAKDFKCVISLNVEV